MKTALDLSHIAVEAGQTARIEIEVTNTEEFIDGVTAIVDGINPEWVHFERPLVSLFPEASDTIVLLIDVPKNCQAGDYLTNVHVVSAVDSGRESVHDFWLTVAPFTDIQIEARPSIIRGGRSGRSIVTVTNTGNVDVDVALSGEEPSREVDCTFAAPSALIPYGQSAMFDIALRGRRPWFGEPISRPVTLRATADGGQAETTATFVQRARIARGLVTALILGAIIALWALIFLFVIAAIRDGGDPAKAIAKDEQLFHGAPNIQLNLIRGTVAGTVSASTTGDGIPKVTVEAFRVKRFPIVPGRPAPVPERTLVSVASGGTDEDGGYELRTLIPGDYVLRFSASGFGEIWYPGELAGDDFLPVQVLDPTRGNDIVMEGVLGSVQVQIDLPDGADASQLTARITPKDGSTFPGAVAFAQAENDGTCSVDQQGLVTCTGLPTPGDYVITVSGPGFDSQRIDVSLHGGDDTVVDTVPLAGEPGTISGAVIDQAGVPLIGARVTISSGQFVARVFSDRAGNFEMDDLPTPADYVVDISSVGYVGRTVALPLAPGQSATVPAQQLIGGVGSISGAVVDESGRRLAGVGIAVSGERSSAQTASLTDGDTGSFFLQDLSVPGTYSVAFTLAGYQTETRIVTFDGAGLNNIGDIAMFTSFGRIEGTVVDPTGAPVPNAKVELIDGLRSRTTSTSTGGSGSFGFSDVAPGSYTIVVSSTTDPNDVKIWIAQRDVGPGEVVQITGLVLPLSALGSVSGVATGPDGAPLSLVSVTLVGGGRTQTATTAAAGAGVGSYAFSGLAVPGTYELTFTLADYETLTRTIELSLANGAFVRAINVEMVPMPGPVVGTVHDSSGEPLNDATVTLVADDGTTLVTQSEPNGMFGLTGVPAGPAVISVEYSDLLGMTGSVVGVNFVVPPGGGDLAAPIVVNLVSVTQTTVVTPVSPTTAPPATVPAATAPPTTGFLP